jgi:hypothetical protein
MGPAACLCVLALAAGCRAFEEHRSSLDRAQSAGDHKAAAAMLDDPRVADLYTPGSITLLKLERGGAALASGDPERALRELEDAERRIDLVREKSAADVASQWLLSDASATYLASPSDDLYVNVLKMLAQFQLGRIEGGATVEARRMARKADLLRDRHLTLRGELESRGGPEGDRARAVGDAFLERQRPRLDNPDGAFIESPLGIFLSAVAFAEAGEREFQRVAARRLDEALRLQRGLVGDVDPASFAGLGERAPGSANVLVVALSGRAPRLRAQRIGPIPIYSLPVYFELPVIDPAPSEIAVASVAFPAPDGGSPASAPLPLIEDLAVVSEENHRRRLPEIYARTLVRYVLKAGSTAAVTEVVAQSADDSGDRDLIRIAGGLAGLALLVSTERADLRSWSTLPGRAYVGLLSLPEGPQRLTVTFRSADDGTPEAQEIDLDVAPGRLSTVIVRSRR